MLAEWTVETLRERCKWWQKFLRLEDWDIYIDIVRRWDMGDERCSGTCSHVLSTKRAWIRILDPVDFEPNVIVPPNIEETLVHEMLHLHFAPFFTGVVTDEITDHEAIAKELAIEVLSRAFAKMRTMIEMAAENILAEEQNAE